MRITRALISVSDKSGVVDFGRYLSELGVEILSTGGTARTLRDAGVPAGEVSDHTGFPEILGGRVKTLHPKIHGGILARHGQSIDESELGSHGIQPIHLVAVNLYPFSRTVARPDVEVEEAIEQIDIGGVTLIRAAAKNAAAVTVVVDPTDYPAIIAELKTNSGATQSATRERLRRKAFHHTAAYDASIAGYFDGLNDADGELPQTISQYLVRHAPLRYGENPHQRAALYRPGNGPALGWAGARQHQGKELSFNNLVDLEAAWKLAGEFDQPFCGIIKHTNPCGAALADNSAQAFARARACDPVSAFGSVIAFNRALDAETAELMGDLFVEAVVAPAFDPAALVILGRKKKLRVLEMPAELAASGGWDWKPIEGGVLVQDRDAFFIRAGDLEVATRQKPSETQIGDLLFAWKVCKHVKSNAIVLARNKRTVGVGAGQMSRVDSVRLAAAGKHLSPQGSAMASDAFFPFADGLEEAAAAGVEAVIQPGGSIRDPEVIEAADRLGMSMVLTGVRHFNH